VLQAAEVLLELPRLARDSARRVSAEAIQRPLISSSRTSTQKHRAGEPLQDHGVGIAVPTLPATLQPQRPTPRRLLGPRG
jgi:hypothetical protein